MKQRIKKERRITRYFLRRKMIVKKSFHDPFMFMEKPFRKNPQNLDKIAPNETDIRRNYQLPNDHRDIFGCPFSLLVTLDNSKKCIVFHQNPDKNINHISQVSIMTHCILLILSSSVLPFESTASWTFGLHFVNGWKEYFWNTGISIIPFKCCHFAQFNRWPLRHHLRQCLFATASTDTTPSSSISIPNLYCEKVTFIIYIWWD